MSKIQGDLDQSECISEQELIEISLRRSCSEDSVSSKLSSENDDEIVSVAEINQQQDTALIRNQSYANVRKESF